MDADRRKLGWAAKALIPTALVGIAVALRAWHVGWGLPDFTEEAIPLQRTFAMRSLATGGIDLHPHAFNYPSLGIYLHLLVQQAVYLAGRLAGSWSNAADYQLAFYLNPTPMVLASRWLGIAADGLAVLAAYRIGRRYSLAAGILSAMLLGFSVTAITVARSIYVDTVMACLALWAVERMLSWNASGGRNRFVAASLLVGLAAGAKYPAAALLLPLGALAFAREGVRGLRALAAAAGIAGLAFLASTPFAVLDPRSFLRDFSFEGRHAAEGHFGSSTHLSFGFHALNLARDLGWPALLVLMLSPLLAWRDRSRRSDVLALWLALLAFGIPISLARIDADRYLLPVVAVAAPLVALATTLFRTGPASMRGLASGALLALLAAMPVAAGVRAAWRGARDTQVEARIWCESHIRSDQLVVTEAYGPRLPDQAKVAELRSNPAYALASGPWRDRVDRLPAKYVVSLPLAVAGRLTTQVALAGRPAVTLEVAPHVEAVNDIYYDPALYSDVDWFISTSAVRGRFSADPARFAMPGLLYRTLDSSATLAATFTPSPDASGPEIMIYQLDRGAHAALARRGAFQPYWWTAAIPAGYHVQLARLMAGSSLPGEPGALAPPAVMRAPFGSDGEPAPWVKSLQPLFQAHVATFVANMANALVSLGHYEGAANFAGANHAMMPNDVPSCLLASAALAATRRWPEARVTIERTLRAIGPGPADPMLELLYARSLAHTGESAKARGMIQRLVDRLPPGEPIAEAASEELSRMR